MYFGDRARFWAKVDERGVGECWPWTAAKTADGYGCIGNGAGKIVGAPRVMYFLWYGKDPTGHVVRHTCDNVSCVSPHHLVLGTHQDNMTDKVRRNRQSRLIGSGNPKSKLSEDQVREIFRRARAGEPMKVLAREFGVADTSIRAIMLGYNWKHLNLLASAETSNTSLSG